MKSIAAAQQFVVSDMISGALPRRADGYGAADCQTRMIARVVKW
ncbi:hypothetical protein [Cypionkella psychrotolerans]|nr:hypothetical protein [Cypionkella psychrotolerans]